MIKFMHTADIHFGVENYGKIDPKTGLHSRLLDFKASFDEIVTFAISNNVDFFLICGDAYKTPNPTPTQQKLLLDSLLRLYKYKIPVVIIVGNHDMPLSFGKTHALDVFASLPVNGFHVFSKPGLLKLETKSGPVQILGIPWPAKNNIMANAAYLDSDPSLISQTISKKIIELIDQLTKQVDRSIPSIIASHLTIGTGIFSGSEKQALIGSDPIFMPSDLPLDKFCYVALGHLHRHQVLSSGNGIAPIVYSGSPDKIDFGEKNDKKGFCYVSIEVHIGPSGKHENICQFEFIPINGRPMLDLEVSVGQGLVQTENILKFLQTQPIEGSIVKFAYRIEASVADCVDIGRIEQALSKAAFIASIKPIYSITGRTARVGELQSFDQYQLLERYLELKGLSRDKKTLIDKAKELNNTICCQDDFNDNQLIEKKGDLLD